METLIFLKKVPLFSNFGLEDLLALKEICEEKEYPAGHDIIKEGQFGSEAYIIVDGYVDIVKNTGKGELVVASMEKTAFFGEMAIIENEPRSASVRTKTACTVLTIKGEVFRDMIKTNAQLSFEIVQTFSRRIRALMKK